MLVVAPGADHGSNGSGASQVADEIRTAGGAAARSFLPMDDYQAAGDIIGQCANAFGWVDIIVNCAGVLREQTI